MPLTVSPDPDFSVLAGTGPRFGLRTNSPKCMLFGSRFFVLCNVFNIPFVYLFDIALRRWVKKGSISGSGSFDLQSSHWDIT